MRTLAERRQQANSKTQLNRIDIADKIISYYEECKEIEKTKKFALDKYGLCEETTEFLCKNAEALR